MSKFLVFFFASTISLYSQTQNDLVQNLEEHTSYDQLNNLFADLDKEKFDYSFIPSIFPLPETEKFKITSLYGPRKHPIDGTIKTHKGIDIASNLGSYVLATANGIVDQNEFSSTGHGKNIILKHKYGYKTRYSHLILIYVTEGQIVKRGDIIGFVGSTGKSTGNHLHYEVIKNNKNINPAPYFFIEEEQE